MRRRLCEVVGEEAVQEAENGEADGYKVGIDNTSAWGESFGEDYDWKIFAPQHLPVPCYMLVETVERDINPPVFFTSEANARAEIRRRLVALIGEEYAKNVKIGTEAWAEAEGQNYTWKIFSNTDFADFAFQR